MTKIEKQNCLKCRYAFEKNYNQNVPQQERRRNWVSFVQESNLSQNENKYVYMNSFHILYPKDIKTNSI